MKRKTNNIIAWRSPEFKQDKENETIIYEEQVDFLVAIHLERLLEYISALYKAGELSGVHEKIFCTLIATAQKEINEYASTVKTHLGKLSVEYVDDKVIGCVMELQ